MDFSIDIKGHTLEFIESGHTYLVDGVMVGSITQIVNLALGNKYENINKNILRRAAQKGIAVHEAIENYCKNKEESDLPELQGFKSLKRLYEFNVVENEVPVILFHHDEPVAAGRLDMVIEMGGNLGGADIKRTQKLDKNYLGQQLNLYRIAYKQCYDKEWTFLRGIHLRDDLKEFITIPVNEPMAWHTIKNYLGVTE